MENYGLSTCREPQGNFLTNLQLIGPFLKSFSYLIHAGEFAQAESELRKAAIRYQHETFRLIVNNLTEIANQTNDPSVKMQMFNMILQYGYSIH